MFRKNRALEIIILFACLAPATVSAQPSDELIQTAGNAETEETRLAALQQLVALPDIDASLRADTQRMIIEVERYINHPRLNYFERPVFKEGAYDFGIAEESPIYPLTYLYQARMLVWLTMEHGGYWSVAKVKRKQLDKVRTLLEQARAAYPENRITRMYLGEVLPREKEYPVVSNAPEWAVYQREGLEGLNDIIEWWIDHRLQESGEYGGQWGDDCEMWRWWVPVLIGFDNPKIGAAQAKFSRALMAQEHMQSGFTTRIHDVEHTAEDSSDAITPMIHLEPDAQEWQQMALRLSELMEEFWTGENERGQLQFKSTYFSVNDISQDKDKACDTVYHPRAVQPALLYWQRTGDERLGRLFPRWMDTWVVATARAERGKPAGIIPSAIHWPDGAIGGLGEHWWVPENHDEATLYTWPSAMRMMTHTLLLTHHMTGEEKYLEPLRSMAAIRLDYLNNPPAGKPEPGSQAWCAAKLGQISGPLSKYAFLTGSDEFDDLLKRDASGYVAYRFQGDMEKLTQGLKHTAESFRINFPGYTSEVRYTDRVLRFPALFGGNGMYPHAVKGIQSPNTSLLYSTSTGDPGSAGYFPLNAVRWKTPPIDIAALVTDSGKSRFAAQLFHFGEASRPMAAEFYLLRPGDYTLCITAENKVIAQQLFTVNSPRTTVPFELPAQALCHLVVE